MAEKGQICGNQLVFFKTMATDNENTEQPDKIVEHSKPTPNESTGKKTTFVSEACHRHLSVVGATKLKAIISDPVEHLLPDDFPE